MVPRRSLLRAVACLSVIGAGSALVAAPTHAPALRQGGVTGLKLDAGRLLRRGKEVAVAGLRGGREAATSNADQGQGTSVELVTCVSGIYFCYLYYGVLQEDLLTSAYGPEKKSFKDACSLLFLMAVQCSIGAVLSRIACLTSVQPLSGWQSMEDYSGFAGRLWPLYMQVGFCYVLAMLLSNGALSFINYPTQVIVKSCKMIPVMAVSVLWRNKVYPIEAYFRVSMVTAGIIMFTFFKKASKGGSKAANRQVVGLLMALGSLLMDGFVGPTQEEIFSRFNSSTHQMMYYTNMWALLLLGTAALATGEGQRAISFVVENPRVLSKITQFGVLSATGQFFIFFLVRSFSALTLVTVTTTRKFFTVLASILWFKHPLSVGQWASVAIVFAGLTWEEASKYMAKLRRRSETKAAPAPPAPLAAPADADATDGTDAPDAPPAGDAGDAGDAAPVEAPAAEGEAQPAV
mmetsp:Transcript_48116/g.114511  ORF Transcript_48116/g.114511 Transcript_48116/m.114511 type:complete len:462 (-) Transcript_48116:111-1496(-)